MAKRLGILLLFCTAAFLAVSAYWLLFTTFMGYDDEGYVLISLKNYCEHGGLYARVFSQYGPFFYFIHDVGHRLLGYEFTNTTGRFITLLCWMTAAGASAHLVWRQTRAVALTGFTLTLTFFYLRLMVSEPAHPGGLIAALVAVGAWQGAKLITHHSLSRLAIMSGLIGAALLLIKINVGVFFLMAAGAWFAIQLREFRQARLVTLVITGLLILLPLGLMFAEIDQRWCRIFAELSIVANLTMVSVGWRNREPLTTWRQAGCACGTVFLFGLVVLGAVGLRGTTLPEMMDGILLSPLRHPTVYHFPPDWKPGAELVGGFSLGLAILVWNGYAARLSWLLIGLRLTLIFWVCLASSEWLALTSHSSVMSYAMPLAWIFVLRLGPNDAKGQPNETHWIGLLLVLQFLHAYPVGGSQIAWGTFLIIPLMGLSLHDTRQYLGNQWPARFSAIINIGCFVLAGISAGRMSLIGWHHYTDSFPLRLPGAEDVRPPEELASTLRVMALNAAAHGDMLFSLPGMFSFNGWTDLPTPTLNNTTHWFSLLNLKQQEETISALAASKRPVLLVNQGLVEFLKENNFPVSSPLFDYLNQNFAPAFKLGKYEFWTRRGRTILPLFTAEFLQLATPQLGLPPDKLELVVMLPAGSVIGRIELVSFREQSRVLAHWDKTAGPLLVTGLNVRGESLTPETNSGWNQPLPTIARLNLPLENIVVPDRKTSVIYLRDINGKLLAEARFIE